MPHTCKNYIKALSDEQGLTSSIYSNPGKESSLEISRDFKLSERENTVLCWMYSSTFIKIQHPQQFIPVKLYVVVVEKENT